MSETAALPPLPPLPKPTAKPKPAPKAKQLPAPKPLPEKPLETPHYSEDAEMCALGSMLWDQKAAEIVCGKLTVKDFYLGKHRILYSVMSELFSSAGYIDFVNVEAELKTRAVMEQIGNWEYIDRIMVKTPSAAGVDEYCRIVLEHSQKRQLHDIARQILKSGSLVEAKELIEGVAQKKNVSFFTWSDAMKFNAKDDPNCILGRRWLSRGGSCVWVGSTGIGKSSILAQAAALWAAGLPFFGIIPARPLRSLIIQAENDEGDIGEITQGVTKGLNLEPHMGHIGNICFGDKTAVAGDLFMPYARELIEATQPDILWIDPLYAFCGCDVSDQGAMSKFLRLGLQKIAQDTGVCVMVVHHTNKIKAADKFSISASTPGEDAYSGSGTAEISNWARAVMRVKRRNNGEFELIAAKRGSRAGLIDAHGNFTETVYLKHAPRPDIYWLPAEQPIDLKAVAEREAADDIINAMTVGQMYSKSEIKALAAKIMGKTINYVGVPDRPAFRSWQLAMRETEDKSLMGMFVRRK